MATSFLYGIFVLYALTLYGMLLSIQKHMKKEHCLILEYTFLDRAALRSYVASVLLLTILEIISSIKFIFSHFRQPMALKFLPPGWSIRFTYFHVRNFVRWFCQCYFATPCIYLKREFGLRANERK